MANVALTRSAVRGRLYKGSPECAQPMRSLNSTDTLSSHEQDIPDAICKHLTNDENTSSKGLQEDSSALNSGALDIIYPPRLPPLDQHTFSRYKALSRISPSS